MKVAVIGGSGVLGARLVAQCVKAGHSVVGVVFRPDSVSVVERLGGTAVLANVLDRGTLYKPLEGSDIIVNASASIPVDPARSIFCNAVQKDGFKNVAHVASSLKIPNLVTLSFVRAGQPWDESFFTEDSPSPSPSSSAREGEVAAMELLATTKTKHMVLRLGLLYSGDSQFCQSLAANLHASKALIIGSGDNVVQVLHSDDAAMAVTAVMQDMLHSSFPVNSATNNKLYHVVDDDGGITFNKLMAKLAVAIGAPTPKKTPAFIAKMVIQDQDLMRLLTTSVRTSNANFKRAFPEWSLRYPSFDIGVNQMATWWKMLPQTRHLVVDKS